MKQSYFKYILSLLLLGSNGIVASNISLSSYEIVFMRALIGSVFLLAVFLLSKGRFTFLQKKRDFAFLAVSGAAMGASWIFLYEAYAHIGVSIASLLYYCGPVVVMALSPLLFKEKLTLPKIIGFAAVLAGVFLINGQAFQESKTAWGLICGGLSAVTYAVMVIFNKKAKGITGLENSTLQLIIGFIAIAVFLGIKQRFAISVAPADWIWIIILGLINTGVGCYLYFSSINGLPVQTVAICGYLEPLSAIILSVILLNEAMLPLQIAGAALIIGGAVFGELFSAKHSIRLPNKTSLRN